MKYQVLACLPLLAALTGCASIVKGGAQDIVINSDVPEARFEVRNNRTNSVQLTGATPATVKLDKGAGYFQSASYTVTISKDGYVPQIFPVTGSVNGWYAGGNLLIGGLIGYLVVDPATGAMWTLDPAFITSSLTAVAPAPTAPTEPAPPLPEAAPASTEPSATAPQTEAALPASAPPAAMPVPGAALAAVAPVSAPAAPALAAGGVARLLGPARTRATPEGAPVQGLEAGATVKLKVAVQNGTGAWWYVSADSGSGWVKDSDLAPVTVQAGG